MKLTTKELITKSGLKSWNEILKEATEKVKKEEVAEKEKELLTALSGKTLCVTFFFTDKMADALEIDVDEKNGDTMKLTVATKVTAKGLIDILENGAPVVLKRRTNCGLYDNVNGYCQTMRPIYQFKELDSKELVGYEIELESGVPRFYGYKIADALDISEKYFI